MFMLKTLKEMQQRGVFKLFPNDTDINGLITNAKSDEDIKSHLPIIQTYIKNLDIQYTLKYDVSINPSISDFCDKFQYTMFDMYMDSTITNGYIYEKDISYGSAGVGKFAISSDDSIKFTLLERKLIKLINHYYIKLKSTDHFTDEYFYIPLNKLKSMYVPDTNNLVLKESLIETCDKLNNKKVYWNMSPTQYANHKKFKEQKLVVGKNENLVDITIIYQPREHEKGIDGKVNTIKGILCKINKFMELRYLLRQISNDFPAECLRKNYLDFVIMEKIIYQLNIINANNAKRIKVLEDPKTVKAVKDVVKKKVKNQYKKKLVDLASELYYYDTEQTSKDYFTMILTEPNSKRRIMELLNSLISVAQLLDSHNKQALSIIVKKKAISLFDGSSKLKKPDVVYNEMLDVINKREQRGQVLRYLRDGEIEIIINN